MIPIELESFTKDLEKTHWHLLEAEDLSSKFIIWYNSFLVNLREEKEHLEQSFSKKDIIQVDSSLSFFLEQLKTKKMGGVVIYAIKQ